MMRVLIVSFAVIFPIYAHSFNSPQSIAAEFHTICRYDNQEVRESVERFGYERKISDQFANRMRIQIRDIGNIFAEKIGIEERFGFNQTFAVIYNNGRFSYINGGAVIEFFDLEARQDVKLAISSCLIVSETKDNNKAVASMVSEIGNESLIEQSDDNFVSMTSSDFNYRESEKFDIAERAMVYSVFDEKNTVFVERQIVLIGPYENE